MKSLCESQDYPSPHYLFIKQLFANMSWLPYSRLWHHPTVFIHLFSTFKQITNKLKFDIKTCYNLFEFSISSSHIADRWSLPFQCLWNYMVKRIMFYGESDSLQLEKYENNPFKPFWIICYHISLNWMFYGLL